MARRGGDRRTHARFEVVGELAGTLQTTTVLDVRDISIGGALLESSVPLAEDELHRLTTLDERRPSELSVRVVRQTQIDADRFAIGVEFVSATPLAMEQIAAWIDSEPDLPDRQP